MSYSGAPGGSKLVLTRYTGDGAASQVVPLGLNAPKTVTISDVQVFGGSTYAVIMDWTTPDAYAFQAMLGGVFRASIIGSMKKATVAPFTNEFPDSSHFDPGKFDGDIGLGANLNIAGHVYVVACTG